MHIYKKIKPHLYPVHGLECIEHYKVVSNVFPIPNTLLVFFSPSLCVNVLIQKNAVTMHAHIIFNHNSCRTTMYFIKDIFMVLHAFFFLLRALNAQSISQKHKLVCAAHAAFDQDYGGFALLLLYVCI